MPLQHPNHGKIKWYITCDVGQAFTAGDDGFPVLIKSKFLPKLVVEREEKTKPNQPGQYTISTSIAKETQDLVHNIL